MAVADILRGRGRGAAGSQASPESAARSEGGEAGYARRTVSEDGAHSGELRGDRGHLAATPSWRERISCAFAERDAQAIFTALISPEGGNFRVENVHVLTNEKATLAGLRREIDTWLPSVAKDDDRVLIYFAGHGFMFQGKGYLAPADFDRERIAETGYPMDDLGSVIGGKIKAKSKILLTDACHSGAITPEDTENLNNRFGDLTKSLFSLTASRARERSYEVADLKGGHGVFTYYVVQGMEGAADASGDGVVTADELAEYVHTQVREYTDNKQNPTSDKANYDPEMLLAYVPSKAKPAAAPAPKFGTLIFDSNMDGVEVFVDGKTIGVLEKGKPVSRARAGSRRAHGAGREDGLRAGRSAAGDGVSGAGIAGQDPDPDSAAAQ